MYCQNCGTKSDEKDVFCRNCGNKISTDTIVNQINYTQVNDEQVKIEINDQTVYVNDEFLLSTYIGKNYNKFKKGSFSLSCFFLGPVYVAYRKMWSLLIIWLCIMLVPIISPILSIIVGIIISIDFKSRYIRYSKKQVQKIKQRKSSSSNEKIMRICKRKGGTSLIAPLIVIIVIYMIITAPFAITRMINEKEYNEEVHYSDKYTSVDTFYDLKYKIPYGFKKSKYNYEIPNHRYYLLDWIDDNCDFSLDNNLNENYDDIYEYLDSVSYLYDDKIINDIETLSINNTIWYTVEVKTSYNFSYYYATEYNDKYYLLNFSVKKDSGLCEIKHKKIVDSLEFE